MKLLTADAMKHSGKLLVGYACLWSKYMKNNILYSLCQKKFYPENGSWNLKEQVKSAQF